MAKKATQKKAGAFDELINKPPKITVLSDNPVSLEQMNSDTFNFSYHLGPIYDIIRHKKTQMPPTIGVYGKWGSGKTTAMKWLDGALGEWKKSDGSKDKVTTKNVWFYPWKYHDKEDIWRGLISEVIIEAIDIKNASPKTVMTAVKKFGGFMGNSFLHVLDEINLKGKIGKEEMGIEGEAEMSLGMVKKNINNEVMSVGDWGQFSYSLANITAIENQPVVQFLMDDLKRNGDGKFAFDNLEVSGIPEPASLLLLALGSLAIRKKK